MSKTKSSAARRARYMRRAQEAKKLAARESDFSSRESSLALAGAWLNLARAEDVLDYELPPAGTGRASPPRRHAQ
jgi:hypothetical protein